MGKSIFSVISSLISIGILAFLIYFCCLRRRRNNGRTIQATTVIGTIPTPQTQPHYPAATSGYPTQPSTVWPSYGQPGLTNPQFGPPYPAQTNYTGGGAPYPTTENLRHAGMPMPMPNAAPPASFNNNYAPTAPPPTQDNDLPPPYSSVVRGS